MQTTVREVGRVTIVAPSGDISLGGTGIARPLDLHGERLPDVGETLKGILGRGTSWILLDLADVRFIDSAGLGSLIQCKKRAVQGGGDLRLMRPGKNVVSLLEMTGLTKVFRVFANEQDALASFES